MHNNPVLALDKLMKGKIPSFSKLGSVGISKL